MVLYDDGAVHEFERYNDYRKLTEYARIHINTLYNKISTLFIATKADLE